MVEPAQTTTGKGWLQPIDVLKFLGFILPSLIVMWVFFAQIHESIALQQQRLDTIEGNHLLHIQDSIAAISVSQKETQKELVDMKQDITALLTTLKGYKFEVEQ